VLDALQQRDAECQGLARAGSGLSDDVVPAEPDGQGEFLNGERVDDALGLEGVAYLGTDSEFTERSQGFQPPSCGVLTPGSALGPRPGGRAPSPSPTWCGTAGSSVPIVVRGRTPVLPSASGGRADAREGPSVNQYLGDRCQGYAQSLCVAARGHTSRRMVPVAGS